MRVSALYSESGKQAYPEARLPENGHAHNGFLQFEDVTV
jgi:hypothetical protein